MQSLKLMVVLFFFVLSGCSLASRFERESGEVGRVTSELQIAERSLAEAKAARSALNSSTPQPVVELADLEVTRLSVVVATLEGRLRVAKRNCEQTETLMVLQNHREADLYRRR